MLPLECSWSGASIRAESRISDISMGGCYVDCRNVPPPGTDVHLSISLGGARLEVDGLVVHNHPNIGFGVRFNELAPDVRAVFESHLG